MATYILKKLALAILYVNVAIGFATTISLAQQATDTIFLKQGLTIGAQKLKKKGEHWQFWYQNADGTRTKTRLPNALVDSISRTHIAETVKKGGAPKKKLPQLKLMRKAHGKLRSLWVLTWAMHCCLMHQVAATKARSPSLQA
jgi:hypothetical protein